MLLLETKLSALKPQLDAQALKRRVEGAGAAADERLLRERQAILATVTDLLCNQLPVQSFSIDPSKLLAEDLGLDELDKIELCLYLEEEYGMDLPRDADEKMSTVADVVQLVLEHQE
jgi:acyl carrier protein